MFEGSTFSLFCPDLMLKPVINDSLGSIFYLRVSGLQKHTKPQWLPYGKFSSMYSLYMLLAAVTEKSDALL